ncbi:hypothetical protein J6590_107154 [Homalodisca vitripennis]|nr:hypothetical protein J6590_107154 [Homalodisca vitripennis]
MRVLWAQNATPKSFNISPTNTTIVGESNYGCSVTRGHSFLPCDREFGLIKRMLNKHDRIFSMYEIIEVIIKSAKPGKFLVKEVRASEISNFKSWWIKYYKNTPVSEETKKKPSKEKVKFGISKLFHFVFESTLKGYIKAYTTINGLHCHTFFMSLTNTGITGPSELAYPEGKVPIKKSKLQDLRKVIQYVPHENRQFYNDILEWPVMENINMQEEDE